MKLSSVVFLLIAVLSLPGQRANQPSSKHNSGQVGLQLYSLRNQFKTDVPRTLDQVRSFGIKYVELAGTYGVEPTAFNEELKAKGLRAISAHYSYEQFRDHIDDVIREAKVFALDYVGCPWIDPPPPLDEKKVHEMAGFFNRAGQLLTRRK